MRARDGCKLRHGGKRSCAKGVKGYDDDAAALAQRLLGSAEQQACGRERKRRDNEHKEELERPQPMHAHSVYYRPMQALAALPPRVLVRNALIPLAALASVFVFPDQWLVIAFLVLGQAHFFMAALYQWRGGRVDARYVITALALLALFIVYFASGAGFYPIFFVTVFMFGVHFARDEFMLQRMPFEGPQKVTVILFTALFLLINIYALSPADAGIALSLSLLFPAYIGTRLFFSKSKPNQAEAYVWFVGLLLFALAYFAQAQPVILLAIVSILHIGNWYIDFGRRLADAGDAARHRSYWTEVVAIIALMGALYAAFRVFDIAILQYLFTVMYYYAWALAHFVLSYRPLKKA